MGAEPKNEMQHDSLKVEMGRWDMACRDSIRCVVEHGRTIQTSMLVAAVLNQSRAKASVTCKHQKTRCARRCDGEIATICPPQCYYENAVPAMVSET